MSDLITDKLNNYKKVVLEHRSKSQDLLFEIDDLLAGFGDFNDPQFLDVLYEQISTIFHWFDKEGDPELGFIFAEYSHYRTFCCSRPKPRRKHTFKKE